MLDSTDPAAVRAAATPPSTTLFIVASKSGTTIEPNSLAAHFRERLDASGVASWASHFIAITDEGTALATRARADKYREVFINPGDIGGRYSALSFFGMVPAALMGQNVGAIVGHGLAMLAAADPARGPHRANPAALLGLAMGAAARAGRDKLTLLLPPQLEPIGLWIEQLIAESTGKHGSASSPLPANTTCQCVRRRPAVRANQPQRRVDAPSPGRHTRPVASIISPAWRRLAASSCAGKSRRQSRARCSRSIPSTSRTCSRPRKPRRILLDGFKKTGAFRCRRRAPRSLAASRSPSRVRRRPGSVPATMRSHS